MASSAGIRRHKAPLTYDQVNKLREEREREMQRQKKEKQERNREHYRWLKQIRDEEEAESARNVREYEAKRQQEQEAWNKALAKRDRQVDPAVNDMSAEDQFICDNMDECEGEYGRSDYFSFEFVEHERSKTDHRLVWECKRCGQYHVASRLYSPCQWCKKQTFETHQDYENPREPNYIACSRCGRAKIDEQGKLIRDVA